MTTDTRYKLEEAEFFLGFLKPNYGKQKKFDFYLSAFFGAARSVTWMMNAEYGGAQGFKEWYDAEQAKADDLLKKGTTNARNRSLKSEPLRTLEQAIVGDLYTDTPGDYAEAQKLMDRIMRERVPFAIGGSSGKYRIEAVIDGRPVRLNVRQAMFDRRLKEFPGEHILTVCNRYYKWLSKLVADCEAKFRREA